MKIDKSKKHIEKLKKEAELKNVDAIIELGQIFYLGFSDYENALSYFLLADKLNPNDSWILACIGLMYEKLSNYTFALKYYKKAYELDKDWPSISYTLGVRYFDKDNFKLAIKYFLRFIKIVDQTDINALEDGYLKLGVCYYSLNKYKQSFSYINKCLALNINNAIALMYKGSLLRIFDKNDEAVKYIKLVIKSNEKNLFDVAYDILSDIYQEKGNFKKTIYYAKKVLKIDSQNASALFNLGMAYLQLKSYKIAKDYFNECLKYEKDKKTISIIYNNLSVISVEENNRFEQLNYLTESVRYDECNFSAYVNLGAYFFGEEKYEQAILYYKRALELEEKSQIYVIIGDINIKLLNLSEAEYYYKKAIEIDKTNSYPYRRIGDIFWDQENYGAAIEYFYLANEVDKNDYSALTGIAEYHLLKNNVPEALKYCYKAYLCNKKDAYTLFLFAKLLDMSTNIPVYITKKGIKSLDLIIKAMELEFELAFIYYSSYYYDNKVAFEDAVNCLEKAIELGSKQAYVELGRLYSLKDHLNKDKAKDYFNKALALGIDCSFEINNLENKNNSFLDIYNEYKEKGLFDKKYIEILCRKLFENSYDILSEKSKLFLSKCIKSYYAEETSSFDVSDYSDCILFLSKVIENELTIHLGEKLFKYLKNNKLENTFEYFNVISGNKYKTINQLVYPFKKKNKFLIDVHVKFLLNEVFKEDTFSLVSEEIHVSNYMENFIREINKFVDSRNAAAHIGVVSKEQCDKWLDKMIGSGKLLPSFLMKLR